MSCRWYIKMRCIASPVAILLMVITLSIPRESIASNGLKRKCLLAERNTFRNYESNRCRISEIPKKYVIPWKATMSLGSYKKHHQDPRISTAPSVTLALEHTRRFIQTISSQSQLPQFVTIPLMLSFAIACTKMISLINASNRRQQLRTKMNPFQAVTRSFTFWIRAAPTILHYQWAKIYIHLARKQHSREEIYECLHEIHAPRTLSLILQMRGLFVKFGQVLSSRPDFVASQYIDLLQTLQDEVPPMDEDAITSIVKDALWNDHRLEMSDVFEGGGLGGLLGTASIGQVHRATLTEECLRRINFTPNSNDGQPRKNQEISYGYSGGNTVAVKVMLPDAEDRFRKDFKILTVSEI